MNDLPQLSLNEAIHSIVDGELSELRFHFSGQGSLVSHLIKAKGTPKPYKDSEDKFWNLFTVKELQVLVSGRLVQINRP